MAQSVGGSPGRCPTAASKSSKRPLAWLNATFGSGARTTSRTPSVEYTARVPASPPTNHPPASNRRANAIPAGRSLATSRAEIQSWPFQNSGPLLVNAKQCPSTSHAALKITRSPPGGWRVVQVQLLTSPGDARFSSELTNLRLGFGGPRFLASHGLRAFDR